MLIYATGFQWMATSTFNMVVGRGGRTLSEKWQTEGTKTFLGLHSQGFPNLFIVTGPQGGGGSFNFTDAIDTHGDYVVWMLSTMRDRGQRRRRRRRRTPEEAYAEHCRQADIATAPLRDCLSYYNGHGEAAPGSLAYYGGGNWHKWRMRGPGDDGALRLRARLTPRRTFGRARAVTTFTLAAGAVAAQRPGGRRALEVGVGLPSRRGRDAIAPDVGGGTGRVGAATDAPSELFSRRRAAASGAAARRGRRGGA